MNIRPQIPSFAFLLLTSIVFGEAQCPGNVVPVRYHSLGDSHMAIDVTVNHSGPFEFMVDTGSQITIIEPSLAAELELQPVGDARVVSGVRRAAAMLVSPDLIEVGPYSVHPAWAVVQSLTQFETLYPKMRGILGEDFLMGFDVLIDRRKKTLCLDLTTDMRRKVRGERIAMVCQGAKPNETRLAHPILLPVQLLGETSQKVILRLDSGANAPILFLNRVEHEPWTQRLKTQRGSVAGTNAIYFRIMVPLDIRIGDQVVSDITFATPIRSSQDVVSVGEDGLLPTFLFKRLFISYRDGFVVLDPR